MEGAPQDQEPLPTEAESRPLHEGLPAEVWLAPWRSTEIEGYGFGPRSVYVESCWLPIMGPTATWLYRRLGSWAEWHPEGFQLDLAELGRSIGISDSLSPSGALTRSFRRLMHYRAVRFDGAQLRTRIALPPLKLHQVGQLTPDLRKLHDELVRQPGSSIGRSS